MAKNCRFPNSPVSTCSTEFQRTATVTSSLHFAQRQRNECIQAADNSTGDAVIKYLTVRFT